MVDCEENRRFFERIRALAEKLDIKFEATHRGIPSDVCQVPEGVPVLDGFGPIGQDRDDVAGM